MCIQRQRSTMPPRPESQVTTQTTATVNFDEGLPEKHCKRVWQSRQRPLYSIEIGERTPRSDARQPKMAVAAAQRWMR